MSAILNIASLTEASNSAIVAAMASSPSLSEEEVSAAIAAIPGYGLSELPNFADKLENYPDPPGILRTTSEALRAFMNGRDQAAFLGRMGLHLLHELYRPHEQRGEGAFEQAEAELLQTIALMGRKGRAIPTSPKNFLRGIELARRNLGAYAASLSSQEEMTAEERVSRQARMLTLFYRNIFSSEDAKVIVPGLLSRVDQASMQKLGFKLSDLARALFSVADLIADRIDQRLKWTRPLFERHECEAQIVELRGQSPMLDRTWRFAESRFGDASDRASAAFQVSEMSWAPVFTLSREELQTMFGDEITDALFTLSLRFGDLADFNPEHIYLGSPIRSRPFIRLDDDSLYLPVVPLLISFPFEIVEFLIGNDRQLDKAYSKARTSYLEDATEQLIREALPSATVYRAVCWSDAEAGKDWENDVVAVLGNHIFLFEAKSGRVKPAARRGGLESLRKNFRQLYIEPGEQAARLELLLGKGPSAAALLRDKAGAPIALDLSKPVIVHSFGICIEHFASITSNRHHFEELGLIEPSDPWSPVLSIGDLRMISAFLDTEIAFFHYLTRRSTIEQIITFTGDEQDLLSVYLTNGFQIDASALKGVRVIFGMADSPVRKFKVPRIDRREPETIGVRLPPTWKLIVAELYRSDSRHRYDMIETILNMDPAALKGLEVRTRKWRAGAGKSDLMMVRSAVGRRTFALVVSLSKEIFVSEEAWHMSAKDYARITHEQMDATECLVILRSKKLPSLTFNAVSFFRMRRELARS